MYNNLKAELARTGISHKQIARQIGISPKTISNKINGHSDFTLPEIKIIMEIVKNSDVNYLFAIQ